MRNFQFSIFNLQSLFVLIFSILLINICKAGNDPIPVVLREWAGYAGISDSTFKTPVYSDSEYTYVAALVYHTGTGADIDVIKYNYSGERIWTLSWSGTGNHRDQAADIAVDMNGNVYVCGMTHSTATNNFDFVTLKINSSGQLQYAKTFNGTTSGYDIATSITLLNDSEICVTGVANNMGTALDYHTIKYSDDGTILWQHDFDYNSFLDIPFDIALNAEDTTILITGASQSSLYDWDYQTVKYTLDGAVAYQGRVSGSNAGFDRAQAIATDSSGNVYITGTTFESNTTFDIKTVKLNKLGQVVWLTTYDSGGDDIANDIIVDKDGYVYICGSVSGNGQDFYTAKLDRLDGTVEWSRLIDGTGTNDTARAMCFDGWGNIVVTGQVQNAVTYYYDFCTVAYSSAGEQLWRDDFDGPDHYDDNATDIASDPDRSIYVTGQVMKDSELQTVTIKYRTDYFLQPPPLDTPSTAYLFYPNEGQLVDTNDSLITDSTHYYTLHHYPQLYFGFGVMNMVWNHIDEDTATTDTLQRVDVSFLNSMNITEAYPADEDTTSYLNYYLAHCSNGITNVNGNSSLVYTDVWPDIDVVYSSNNAGLKMTFVCNPGSNPQEIGLHFEGHSSLSIDQNWYLQLQTALGNYSFEKPRVYQLDTAGNRIQINWQLFWNIPQSGQAVLNGWSSYDVDLPFIIEVSKSTSNICDVNLCWSTYCGGNNIDKPYDLITKEVHSAWFTVQVGDTKSPNLPSIGLSNIQSLLGGDLDAFITQYNDIGSSTPQGNIEWTTFYGGAQLDGARGVDINSSGDVYVTGFTESDNASFHIKPSPNPGSSFNPYDQTDLNGNNSTGRDAFILKITELGFLTWATYFGGENYEMGYDLVLNSKDDVYIVGETISPATATHVYPLKPSLFTNSYNQSTYGGTVNATYFGNQYEQGDGFIARFNPQNELTWSSYFGADGGERLTSICLLSDDKIAVTGSGTSASQTTLQSASCLANTNHEFPICGNSSNTHFFAGGITDQVIAVFNDDNGLVFSTYFGSDRNEADWHINHNLLAFEETYPKIASRGVAGSSDDFAVIGIVNEPSWATGNIPVNQNSCSGNPYYQSTYGGGWNDAYIVKFNNTFSNVYTSYFGGPHVDIGSAIVYCGNDDIYFSGWTASSDVPLNLNDCLPGSWFPICQFSPNDYSRSSMDPSDTKDGFIGRINSKCELTWCTYIGGAANGTMNDIDEIINSLTFDNTNLYFSGFTRASFTDFPLAQAHNFYFQTLHSSVESVIGRFKVGFTTDIADVEDKSSFVLYPNPTDKLLTIIGEFYSDNIFINIFNSYGQLVYNRYYSVIEKQSIIINVESLSKGLYVIAINNGKGVKFVVD